jgi:hypothetical protein
LGEVARIAGAFARMTARIHASGSEARAASAIYAWDRGDGRAIGAS